MHVAECSLIGIYDTFADSFGWHNALHMCVWCVVCTEIMVQCVCAVRFFCVSSHHFNPILRECETMVWFFISQKTFPLLSHTHKLSLFAFIFYKLILLCIEHRVWTHNSIFQFHIPYTENEFKSLSVQRLLLLLNFCYHENAIGSLCIYVFADSKLRFAHRVNCKSKFQMQSKATQKWSDGYRKKTTAYRFILE